MSMKKNHIKHVYNTIDYFNFKIGNSNFDG